jgi:cellulose synthase/poly-beta-1,6-N-acetylglucosamine synthase-like glycosyltransferase
LDYPSFDVLVVDNAPSDGRTQETAARWNVRYLVEPRLGVNRARNCGARASDAEIVAYLDDDAVPEADWLTNLVVGFRDARVMAVAGRILPLKVSTEAERLFELRGGFDRGLEPQSVDPETPQWFEKVSFGDLGTEANMAFRRAVFDAWPGFDERLGRGAPLGGGGAEYAFFAMVERAYRVIYTPAAVVYHPYPQTIEDLYARQLRVLASTAGYLTLLFFEQPRHRRAILRFVYRRFRGIPRPWQARASAPSPRIVPRWRMALACVRGPILYARTLLAPRP